MTMTSNVTRNACRTCGFADCPAVFAPGLCPRWPAREPIRVVLAAVEPQLLADVTGCAECVKHEDGTVTMCETHESLDINALFDRLV